MSEHLEWKKIIDFLFDDSLTKEQILFGEPWNPKSSRIYNDPVSGSKLYRNLVFTKRHYMNGYEDIFFEKALSFLKNECNVAYMIKYDGDFKLMCSLSYIAESSYRRWCSDRINKLEADKLYQEQRICALEDKLTVMTEMLQVLQVKDECKSNN